MVACSDCAQALAEKEIPASMMVAMTRNSITGSYRVLSMKRNVPATSAVLSSRANTNCAALFARPAGQTLDFRLT